MSTEHISEEKKSRVKRQLPDKKKPPAKEKNNPTQDAGQTVSALQNLVGNRAVQRLLAQRSGTPSWMMRLPIARARRAGRLSMALSAI
jgi:hypothetical protein